MNSYNFKVISYNFKMISITSLKVIIFNLKIITYNLKVNDQRNVLIILMSSYCDIRFIRK